MADLSELDRAGTVKIAGSNPATGLEDFFMQVDSFGSGQVGLYDVTGTAFDTNFGAIAAHTLRTASQIGNATGAADFGAGNVSAQTLRVMIATNQTSIPVISTSSTADESAFTYGTTPMTAIGGVFQDTSPSLTAGQQGAVRLTQNRGFHSNLRNSAGTEITSDNNGNAANQRLHTATPDTTTASTALGALNATVSVAMAGMSSVGFQLAAGTLVGTITPQCSVDGGTTWTNCSFFNPANSSISPNVVFGSANTLTILSILPIGGSSNVRVIVTAFTSGTANALLRASQVFGAAGAIATAAFGTVTNTSVTVTSGAALLLAANANRKYAYISNPTGSSIQIQFGSPVGLTNNTGLFIASKSFYEIKGDNLYTGPIYAIAGGNTVVAITEGTL